MCHVKEAASKKSGCRRSRARHDRGSYPEGPESAATSRCSAPPAPSKLPAAGSATAKTRKSARKKSLLRNTGKTPSSPTKSSDRRGRQECAGSSAVPVRELTAEE